MKVKLPRSSTPGAWPTNIFPGELAANTADGKLFMGTDFGVQEIGTNLSVVNGGGAVQDVTQNLNGGEAQWLQEFK